MAQSAQWLSTARVVRRAGFGATGAEVDAAHAQGVGAWVRAALPVTAAQDPGAAATPAPTFPPLDPAAATRGGPGSVAQRTYQRAQREQVTALTGWWLDRMVAVATPLPEKLALGWHDHFATSADKVRSAPEMLAQNERLRTLGRTDFRTLALAMLTDAAMLRWLDGQRNTRAAANENLSREFMELFALGHGGGYTEDDVREGARALTGWTIAGDGTTSVRPAAHDPGVKTVLGVTGPLDTTGFCDAVLARPACAAHVVTRTWNRLVSPAAPSDAALARVLAAHGPGRDLSATVVAVLTDPEVDAAAGSLVLGPVEWAVGAVRALALPRTPARTSALAATLTTLGQLPFHPPSVGGWPSGQAWLSTAAAQARLQAATTWARDGDVSQVADAAPTDRVDAAAHLLGVGTFSDASARVLRDAAADPHRLVAVALTTPEYLTA